MTDILREPTTYQLIHKNRTDGLSLFKNIKDKTIATAFFDPQYRGVVDKLKYGDEGKGRSKARSGLPQMNDDTIISFIKEINRVLKESGYLLLWVDKFHLRQGVRSRIANTDLNLVDMIVWDKGKIGMGYRTRRKCEYLMILQKKPIKSKA